MLKPLIQITLKVARNLEKKVWLILGEDISHIPFWVQRISLHSFSALKARPDPTFRCSSYTLQLLMI